MPTLKVNPKKSSGQDKYQSHKRRSKKSLKIKLGGASQTPDNISTQKMELITQLINTIDYSQQLETIYWLFTYLDFSDQTDYDILCHFIDHLFSNYNKIVTSLGSQENFEQFSFNFEVLVNLLINLIGKFNNRNNAYLMGVRFPIIQPIDQNKNYDFNKLFSIWINNFLSIFIAIRFQTLPYQVWLKFNNLARNNPDYLFVKLAIEVNQWLLQGDISDICIRDINGNSYQFDKDSTEYYNFRPKVIPGNEYQCSTDNCNIFYEDEPGEQPNHTKSIDLLKTFLISSSQINYNSKDPNSQENNLFRNVNIPEIIFIPNNITGAGLYYVRGICNRENMDI